MHRLMQHIVVIGCKCKIEKKPGPFLLRLADQIVNARYEVCDMTFEKKKKKENSLFIPSNYYISYCSILCMCYHFVAFILNF